MLAEHVLGWDTTRYLTSGARARARRVRRTLRRARRPPRRARAVGLHHRTAGILGSVARGFAGRAHPAPGNRADRRGGAGALRRRPRAARWTIADACTGSGCLAVALARELAQASIVATDISADALAVGAAERRTARRRRSHPVRSRQCARRRRRTVRPDRRESSLRARRAIARRFSPRCATTSPASRCSAATRGTELVATVVEQGAARLRPGGYLMFEFGFGQEIVAEALIAATPGLTHDRPPPRSPGHRADGGRQADSTSN